MKGWYFKEDGRGYENERDGHNNVKSSFRSSKRRKMIAEDENGRKQHKRTYRERFCGSEKVLAKHISQLSCSTNKTKRLQRETKPMKAKRLHGGEY